MRLPRQDMNRVFRVRWSLGLDNSSLHFSTSSGKA